MERFLSDSSFSDVPPTYQPVVKVAVQVGERLGRTIAQGWDSLVDKLFEK